MKTIEENIADVLNKVESRMRNRPRGNRMEAEDVLHEIAAELRALSNPCTCGFGGQHDPANPRCLRNAVAGRDLAAPLLAPGMDEPLDPDGLIQRPHPARGEVARIVYGIRMNYEYGKGTLDEVADRIIAVVEGAKP